MPTSPTARSLAFLRKHGWTAAVTERWNPYAKIRQDLFGFVDILAIRADHWGVLAIQATTFENRIARLHKICGEPRAETWVAAGNEVEIWGWKKIRKTGKWELTVVKVGPRQSINLPQARLTSTSTPAK